MTYFGRIKKRKIYVKKKKNTVHNLDMDCEKILRLIKRFIQRIKEKICGL